MGIRDNGAGRTGGSGDRIGAGKMVDSGVYSSLRETGWLVESS